MYVLYGILRFNCKLLSNDVILCDYALFTGIQREELVVRTKLVISRAVTYASLSFKSVDFNVAFGYYDLLCLVYLYLNIFSSRNSHQTYPKLAINRLIRATNMQMSQPWS